jgi:hypothetical protein
LENLNRILEMSLTKEEIEIAALNGYHDLTLAKRTDRGGGELSVRLLLPPISELNRVLSPDNMDEAKRLSFFVDPSTPVEIDDLTYASEEALAEAIKDFFDMALAKADARMQREEVLGGALAERIKMMASALQEWQQRLQPQEVAASKKSEG